MREVLFRGKRKNNGEWVEGGFGADNDLAFITGKVRYYPDTRDSATLDFYEEHPQYRYGNIVVDPETISQFTGLLDKNEKKVFEGDIVKTKYGRLCIVEWFSSPQYCGWDLKPVNTTYNCIYTKAPDSHDIWDADNLEVVGNVWDNPEGV